MINMGLFAHVDAGKTTITEQLLYRAGAIRTLGSVDGGTAHTDFMGIERSRGISVRAAVTSLQAEDTQINLIDTPGHVDFSAEVERALSVIDGAVLVLSAVEGVQANTETIWEALRSKRIPVIFFLNKIDRVGADVPAVMSQIRERLSPRLCPLYLPKPERSEPKIVPVTMPDLAECVAECDDVLLERYLEGTLSIREVTDAVGRLCAGGLLFPVLCGSATQNVGMGELLRAVCDYFPAANQGGRAKHQEAAGVVFKVEHDQSMGRIAHVRLYSGALRSRDSITIRTGEPQKISQIRKCYGEKFEDVGFLETGDMGALCGLTQVRPGDTFGPPECLPEPVQWVEPLLRVSVRAVKKGQYPELVHALSVLNEEEPMLDFYPVRGKEEANVSITGTIQSEVLVETLRERFGIEACCGAPAVIYKETPARAGEGYDAYTMPKPCWAVLRFRIEPGERGSGLVYESRVPPRKIPYRYQHHVELSVRRALAQGLYGWEVTDLRVTLIDGGYHEVHTHPLDFFVATPLALADGLSQAGTVLLEPMLKFRISVPEEDSGRVIGELVGMRAEFDSPTIQNGRFTITGIYPVATSLEFPVRLAALTGGKGILTTRFGGYRECAPDVRVECERRGVDPRERSKYILWARGALGAFGEIQ